MANKKKKIDRHQKAVALKYSPTEFAPKVIAKGRGHLADKILEKAEENKLAVYKDPALVEELDKLDLGNHIPPELYEIVAQILIFVDDLDKIEGYKKYAKQ